MGGREGLEGWRARQRCRSLTFRADPTRSILSLKEWIQVERDVIARRFIKRRTQSIDWLKEETLQAPRFFDLCFVDVGGADPSVASINHFHVNVARSSVKQRGSANIYKAIHSSFVVAGSRGAHFMILQHENACLCWKTHFCAPATHYHKK